MKSKITYKAFIFPVLALSLIFISAIIIIKNYPIDLLTLRWIDYLMAILVLATFFWLVKYETLRKFIFIEIIDKRIIITNIYLNRRNIDRSDIIEFETKVATTRLGNFEETVIFIKNERKVVLSEFFISNYMNIKNDLTNRSKLNQTKNEANNFYNAANCNL